MPFFPTKHDIEENASRLGEGTIPCTKLLLNDAVLIYLGENGIVKTNLLGAMRTSC